MIVDYAPALDRRRNGLARRYRRSIVLGAAAALLGIAALGPVAHGGTTASRVVVHSGDTLWSIADAHYPGDDLPTRVSQIIAANGLESAAVHSGETLVLPPA